MSKLVLVFKLASMLILIPKLILVFMLIYITIFVPGSILTLVPIYKTEIYLKIQLPSEIGYFF